MLTDQKSTQKVTDLPDTSKNVALDKLIGDLYRQYPRPPKDAPLVEKQRQLDFITEGILNSPLMSEDNKQDLRNQTWERNHSRLLAVIHNATIKDGKMPTVNEIAKITGLSRKTTIKHLSEFRHSEANQTRINQFQLMSHQVIVKLYDLAMEGNTKAATVYLNAVGGLAGMEPASNDRPTNNYIQINNNIKIDQLTFSMLPQGVQQQITELVLQGLQTQINQLATSSQNHEPAAG